mmetsp:Transcript_8011/g.12177  ORF Transcript_8011/g.12177 Transcript_8011/m.12177 type:complete len:937 (-) Transcript_8011:40-2850(-)
MTPGVHGQILQMIIIRSMRELGLEENHVHSLMSEISRHVQEKAQRSKLVDISTQNFLKSLIGQVMFPYLDQQRHLGRLIQAQSLVRRYLARQNYKQLKSQYFGNTELAKRLIYFRRLVRDQRSFIDHLDFLHQVYYKPLRAIALQSKGTTLLKEEFSALFGVVPEIRQYSHVFLSNLLAVRDAKWPSLDGIGALFCKMNPLLKLLNGLALDVQYACDTFERLSSGLPKFSMLCKELEHRAAKDCAIPSSFRKLIKVPLQFIAKYIGHLEKFLEHTPIAHANEIVDVQRALSMLRAAQTQVKEALTLTVPRSSILNVQRRLIAPHHQGAGLLRVDTEHGGASSSLSSASVQQQSTLNLCAEETRRFIRQGQAVRIDAKGHRVDCHIVLFSDLLLITKEVKQSNGRDNALKLRKTNSVFPLGKTHIDDNIKEEDIGVRSKNDSVTIFKLEHQASSSTDPEVVYLSANSNAEKQVWFLKIQRQIAANKQVFGVPLEELLAQEKPDNGIPNVVRVCVENLEKHSLKTEGLFRISPNKEDLNYLYKKFDSGYGDMVDFSKVDINTLAELLKLYFRQLPEPLLTFALYDAIIELDESDDVQKVLDQLPATNRKLLEYLMAFLIRVCHYSEHNKMSASNVAIVFGPTLVRERVETLETSMRMPKVVHGIEKIVNHYDKLFRELFDFDAVEEAREKDLVEQHATAARSADATATNNDDENKDHPYDELLIQWTDYTSSDDDRFIEQDTDVSVPNSPRSPRTRRSSVASSSEASSTTGSSNSGSTAFPGIRTHVVSSPGDSGRSPKSSRRHSRKTDTQDSHYDDVTITTAALTATEEKKKPRRVKSIRTLSIKKNKQRKEAALNSSNSVSAFPGIRLNTGDSTPKPLSGSGGGGEEMSIVSASPKSREKKLSKKFAKIGASASLTFRKKTPRGSVIEAQFDQNNK